MVMRSRVSKVLLITSLTAAAVSADTAVRPKNALIAGLVAAQQFAKVIGQHSSFARAEDSEVADAATGYLLSTDDRPRPERFIVSESSAAEIVESTAVAIRSLLNDLTTAKMHAPRISQPDTPNEPAELSAEDFRSAALLQQKWQETDCWVEGTWLESGALRKAASAVACHKLCLVEPDCKFFSYRYGTGDCALSSEIRQMEKEEGTITGLVHCPTNRRRLSQSDCLVEDMAIKGPKTTTVFNIPNPNSCQNLCRAQNSCQFFTWTEELCSLHSAAEGVAVASGAVCGPRTCEAAPAETPQLSGVGVSADEVLYDSDAVIESANNAGSGFLGSLFGNLGGGRGEESVVEGLGGVGSVGGAIQAGIGAMNSIGSVLAAADTVMNTIPIAEMVNTGVALANSGIFSGSGVSNRNPQSSAPEGIDNPSVTCLSEGIRCCIPRLAAANYKKSPPTLNGVSATECQATYVSATDQLCATTLYEDTTCGINVLETSSLTIYRHIVHTPSNNMNNAICECAVSKTVNGDGTRTVTASGKWEYSLAAADAVAEKQQKLGDTADNFSQVARASVKWLDALSGTTSTGGSGSATGFISSILDLTDNVRQRSLLEEENFKPAVVLQPRSCSLWPVKCSTDWQAAVSANQCRGLALLDPEGCPALSGLVMNQQQHTGSHSLYRLSLPNLADLPAELSPGPLKKTRLVCEYETVLAENAAELPLCLPPEEARHMLEVPVLQEIIGENLTNLLPIGSLEDRNEDGPIDVVLAVPQIDTTTPNTRLSVLYNLERDGTHLLGVPVSAVDISVF